MKVVSWNVNGIAAVLRSKKEELDKLLESVVPDVLCLQETKLQEGNEPRLAFKQTFPYQYWSSSRARKGYSGTAILSRVQPQSVTYGIGVAEHDQEGRLVTAEYASFYLVCTYVPNSGDGLKRLDYRRTWNTALTEYLGKLDGTKPVLLVGDLNVAHKEIDLIDPKRNVKSAGFTPEEREDFEALLSRGFTDAWRVANPGVVAYTYWNYRTGARAKNRGWRIDYTVVSERLLPFVTNPIILNQILGSDHCPVACDIQSSDYSSSNLQDDPKDDSKDDPESIPISPFKKQKK